MEHWITPDGDLMAQAIQLKAHPFKRLSQLAVKISVNMDQTRLALADAFRSGLVEKQSLTQIGDAIQFIAPLAVNRFAPQIAAEEQHRAYEEARLTYAVGDGQTSIVDPRPSDHLHDADRYLGYTLLDDPFADVELTEEQLAAMMEWYTSKQAFHVGDGQTVIVDNPGIEFRNRWAKIWEDTTDALRQFVTVLDDERQAARKRSRDDLRKKTRDLRKRRGKL